MKDILTKNIGLKIVSVVLAVLVWMIVVNISNPEIKATKQVQVEVVNDDVITNAGKIYEFTGSDTVTVSYSVRTRDEYKIKSSDFRAYVDMKDLYDVTGSVPVNVEVLNNKDIILDVSAKPSVLRVKVEDIIKTTKDIEYELEGQPADGYAVGNVDISPTSVSITGPATYVGQIKTVRILIDVDGISEDITGTAIPLFLDASGRTIDLDETDVTVNHTTVNYSLTTLIGKSVPVQYEVSGSPAPGYSFIGVEGTLKEVIIRGSKAELAEVNSIVVPASVLNLEGTNVNREVLVDLKNYVPGNLQIVGDSVSSVTMKVEGQEEKHFSINITQVAVTNTVEGLQYMVEPITVGVVLRGIKSDLDSLDPKEILGTVDVANMTEEGIYPADVIFTLPAGYMVKSYTPVTVKVTGKPVVHEFESSQEPESPQIHREDPESESGSTSGEAQDESRPETEKESEREPEKETEKETERETESEASHETQSESSESTTEENQ
ncbi:MAG: CdaR family protein [Lachnospiraceae bacterium]|nr:CdaR family protein [Lachnospiraceae bacterium]